MNNGATAIGKGSLDFKRQLADFCKLLPVSARCFHSESVGRFWAFVSCLSKCELNWPPLFENQSLRLLQTSFAKAFWTSWLAARIGKTVIVITRLKAVITKYKQLYAMLQKSWF